MRTLLIMRHGKSSWKHPVEDHERPLKKRGKRAAKLIGKELATRNLVPELVVSSTAVRARDTARRVAKAMGYEGEIIENEGFYFLGVKRIVQELTELDNALERVMTVGHNPDTENVIETLTGERVTMPTAAVAVIDFDLDQWRRLEYVKGQIRCLLLPRELES